MFKRVIWMGLGAAAGSVSTVWAQKKVRTTIDGFTSKASTAHVIDTAKGAASGAVGTVRSAVSEGRTAMLEAEREMRAARDTSRRR